jgi:hypothetical protein
MSTLYFRVVHSPGEELNIESLISDIDETIEEIKRFATSHDVVDDESEIHKQQLTALLLAARICEISEASVLVMKAGLNNEARSMFRVFLDAYFVFGAVCSDAKNVKEYFATDAAARLKIINVSDKHSSEVFDLIKSEISENEKSNLTELVKKERIQEFKSFNFANLCGCNHIFDSIYRVYSASIHSTPRALDSYVRSENDRIVGIEFNPSPDGISQVAYDLASFLIKVLSCLTEVFGALDQEKIKRKNERLEVIASQI